MREFVWIAALAGLLAACPVSAKDLSAEEILDRAQDTLRSGQQVAVEKMSLINKSGQVRTRELKLWSVGTKKTLIRFLSPADVKGTGFLTVGDDMWLYLPAVGQVRRIAAHMKRGSFMGSDFSYDDIGTSDYKKDYRPRLLGSDSSVAVPAYLLELAPRTAEAAYGKVKLWVAKEDFVIRRGEFYDRQGTLLKVLTASNVERIDGRPVPRKLIMETVADKHRTILELVEASFDTPIPDSVFTDTYLERGE
ncbi:MAG TPA: outer membrane lipoprotein-sorting protein [Firmicutes bacterium]|nr:outer membrane lipoprotein-sorting protein [Bacillota bacterium]